MAKRIGSLDDLEQLRKRIVSGIDPNKTMVTICGGTGCQAYGSDKVFQAFTEEVKRQGVDVELSLIHI